MDKLYNPLLDILELKNDEKIILIKEIGNADSNFLITNLLKTIVNDNQHVCFILLHNNIEHYQNIGKRLGFDFLKQITIGQINIIDILNMTCDIDNLSNNDKLVIDLLKTIKQLINSEKKSDKFYIIFDDISHLLDLGIELKFIITFINCLINLMNEQIFLIINTHVCGKIDKIIANCLEYVTHVTIDVLPLKTGLSKDVTGIILVKRKNLNIKQYHYKAFDKGIKTFHPGESLYNLYK